MSEYRIEKDSMGEMKVPKDAMYAAQTQRAVDNFPISGINFSHDFIRALALVKGAAAVVNVELGLMDKEIGDAIKEATDEIADGKWDDHFPVDVFQTGSGTSTNMNANEVIANRASQILGEEGKVHPNNHVNMGQSSNDVIPTAIHVSACLLTEEKLRPALKHLQATLENRAAELKSVVKTGRTHLMDAMPVTFAQELEGWAAQIHHSRQRIKSCRKRISQLALGGTAVGTGINAHPEFAGMVATKLSTITNIEFKEAENHFAYQSAMDAATELSGNLKTTASALMKIANDIRWMNSGPIAGLGEISLESLQPGSSIMPGKINPVVCEAMMMVCAQVIGNDVTITIGNERGNFQLNVMLPVIAHNLLQSIEILANSSILLADKGIATFTVNEEKVINLVEKNPILVTALNSLIGYDKGAAIAKKAYKEGRKLKDVALEETDLSEEDLNRILDPVPLTEGGIKK